ncbi:ABC-2 family transporter protein [Kribbella solani]|uniref:ABC transporter permease n=1 Tax=Kribbella solani TaxID=236067 RepID=UPI0029A9CDDC|nr:ABC-2 family transporter protein [Kribbella solani]MDX2973842.1 ABC-2 family transporter protein [Kribbella solani]MDX3001411.1 ABC-2 family transporter protein [Kribbella solani]
MADVSWVRQYVILQRAALRAQLQYRVNFWTTLMGGVAYQGTQLLFLGVLLGKFGLIAGWGFREVAFVFAMRLASHALYVVPFGSLRLTDLIVRDGEFDRVLLRPVNPFLQLITRQFPLMSIGDALLGFGALIVFGWQAPVEWSVAKVGYLLLAVIGGGLVETGIQTFFCGLSFVAASTFSLRIFADNSIMQFSGYPLTMFGRGVFYGFCSVFPMAFIAFLPASLLLGRTGDIPLPVWLIAAAPVAGPVVLALGYAFFIRMLPRYASPGS